MKRAIRIFSLLSITAALATGLLGAKCTASSLTDGVTVNLNPDLSSLRVSLQFGDNVTANMMSTLQIKNFGYMFINPATNSSPLEIGFELVTSVFLDPEYLSLEEKDTMANGTPMPNGKPMIELSSGAINNDNVALYGYLDVADQEWAGAAGIFKFINSTNFPPGLVITQFYNPDENGKYQIIVSIMGAALNNDGTMKTPGGMSIFANVKNMISRGGLEPGKDYHYKPIKQGKAQN